MCDVKIGDDEDMETIGTPEGPRLAHRVCLLRNVMGGIGHLTDHEHWCSEMHDPDMGLSYYESALLVDEWVYKNGRRL
jgi:hypothetical protein